MKHVEKILVALDVVTASGATLHDVRAIARIFGGEVTLLYVSAAGRDAAEARTRLAGAADELHVKHEVVTGEPAVAIAEAARASDLVVLFPSAPIASVTRDVLIDVECDVLSLPSGARPLESIRSIVCGAGFTKNDRVVLPRADEIARAMGAKLTVVHVTPSARRYGPGGVHDAPALERVFIAEASQRMRDVTDEAHLGDAATLVLCARDVASGINEAVRRASADLVIIGRRPYPGFAGGACHRVATEAIVPVLALAT